MDDETATPDPLRDEILAARAHVQSAIHAAKLANDPAAALLDSGLVLIDVMYRILRMFQESVARPTLSQEEIQKISHAIARTANRRANALIRAHLAGYVMVGVGVVIGVALTFGLGAYIVAGGFK